MKVYAKSIQYYLYHTPQYVKNKQTSKASLLLFVHYCQISRFLIFFTRQIGDLMVKYIIEIKKDSDGNLALIRKLQRVGGR